MKHRFLVTGGCGSVGSALVEHLLNAGEIVCSFDHNEDGLFRQLQSLSSSKKELFKPFIGDVRDLKRLEQALSGVDYVYHCAALKHVRLCEYNPFEALKTNVDGTNNVVVASINARVKKVVLTSSDKAVNPSSTMGTTKLLAEKIITSGNNIIGSRDIKLSSVRFGNVWNTAGSVAKIFKTQCENNEKITLTSPEMSRFFVTMKNAIELCEFAMENMLGGEVFISHMGTLNIGDLANEFKEKFSNNKDFKVIGLHPGEKLYEELYTEQEATRTGKFGNYYVILPENQYHNKTINYWTRNKKLQMVNPNKSLRSDISLEEVDPKILISEIS